MGDKDPTESAFARGYEVFGEAAAAEPSEGSLDRPSARDEHESIRRVRAPDDFDRPSRFVRLGPALVWARITAVGWHNQGSAERIEDGTS